MCLFVCLKKIENSQTAHAVLKNPRLDTTTIVFLLNNVLQIDKTDRVINGYIWLKSKFLSQAVQGASSKSILTILHCWVVG